MYQFCDVICAYQSGGLHRTDLKKIRRLIKRRYKKRSDGLFFWAFSFPVSASSSESSVVQLSASRESLETSFDNDDDVVGCWVYILYYVVPLWAQHWICFVIHILWFISCDSQLMICNDKKLNVQSTRHSKKINITARNEVRNEHCTFSKMF